MIFLQAQRKYAILNARWNYYQNLGGITMAYKITDACIACGACVSECPVSCIKEGDIYTIEEGDCIDCNACAGVCPVDACVPA